MKRLIPALVIGAACLAGGDALPRDAAWGVAAVMLIIAELIWLADP